MAAEVTPDDHPMFSYTSGTTGDPKGVKLTHKMLVQCCTVGHKHADLVGYGPNETESYISYLPSAHSFEQILFSYCLIYGVKCGFYSGDPLKLVKEDIPALKPNHFHAVPRILNRIYSVI